MNMDQAIGIFGDAIYGALALEAVWGVFCVILLARRIKRKRFPTPEAEELFQNELRDHLQAGDLRRAAGLCQSPANADRALPQLVALALDQERTRSGKLRGLLISRFESGLLADLEYRLSWIHTMVRSAPMLGLLGTVAGMIGAFGKIAGRDHVDPTTLAGDISLALLTTFFGLLIAIPLVLCAVMLNVRIRRLEDSVESGIDRVLDEMDAAASAQAAKARAGKT